MSEGVHIPESRHEFAACLTEVAEVLDVNLRLPDWPFLAPTGYVSVCQYDHILGVNFVPVLQALSAAHGDGEVTLVTLEPLPSYYWKAYSHFPGFRVERASLPDGYWSGLNREPGGDPAGAVVNTANVVALAGSSHAWAVWGQRDWELGLVLTPTPPGDWLEAGVPFLDAREALVNFRGPRGWTKELTELEIASFLRNVEERGSGSVVAARRSPEAAEDQG
jgi:hypothetical protein